MIQLEQQLIINHDRSNTFIVHHDLHGKNVRIHKISLFAQRDHLSLLCNNLNFLFTSFLSMDQTFFKILLNWKTFPSWRKQSH